MKRISNFWAEIDGGSDENGRDIFIIFEIEYV
jgi:hypothetical protein